MKLNKSFATRLLAIAAFCAMTVPAVPQVVTADVITLGTANGLAGATVDIPVFVRDLSGTPLGIDQAAGSRIQAFSIKLNYPAAQVQSISFDRAGITAGLTPTFESKPAAAGTLSLIVTFDETTNLVPFVSNAAAPGNQIGVLHVTIAPAVSAGSSIPLTFDTALTQLSNEGGTISETVTNGRLAVVNGAISVLAQSTVPTLSQWGLALLIAALAFLAMRVRL